MGRILEWVRDWLQARETIQGLRKENEDLNLRLLSYMVEREQWTLLIDRVHRMTARVPTSRPAETIRP